MGTLGWIAIYWFVCYVLMVILARVIGGSWPEDMREHAALAVLATILPLLIPASLLGRWLKKRAEDYPVYDNEQMR